MCLSHAIKNHTCSRNEPKGTRIYVYAWWQKSTCLHQAYPEKRRMIPTTQLESSVQQRSKDCISWKRPWLVSCLSLHDIEETMNMLIVRRDPKSIDIMSMPTLVVAYTKHLIILNPIRSDSCTHHAHPNCTLLQVTSKIPISMRIGCKAYIFTHNMICFSTHLLRSSSCSFKAFDTYIVVAIAPYFCTILAPFIVGGWYTL